ncbi:DNA adenine methylase [Paenibacillus graminis]|uniref:DNA adenine methylase n=1 Tax=Paenibacillus graminis TaxID=189425 RepID=UPI002DBE7D88|nr:DNA adenine methylase [Paenibacillus graminis]MEC0171680.1 DNA adenine methylase [Paenibacillus graminis]
MGTRSPLIWFGGKSKYAEYIISRFPVHKKYVEPFGGAAHVIAQKPRITHEVYNDIDDNVVNFLMVNRKYPERLAKACISIPYSRAIFERWKREQLPSDPFERAVRWFYMNRSAISKGNAEEVPQTGWRHSTVSGQNPANGYITACNLLKSFSDRMSGVMIEKEDFRVIIPKYDDEKTLFYVDPPYVGREKYYAGGFSEEDHRELAKLLKDVQGKVVLSYYEDPLIEELYSGWNREYFDAHRQVVGYETQDNSTEELLLMNFDNGQLTLF